MPLGRADTRTDERDYYQAIPDESEDGDTPEVRPSRSNFCGTLDVQSNGANPMVGEQQQQQRRHSDTDNDNNSSSSKRARRSTLYSVTGYIIVTEFCERLAYYGFAGKFRVMSFPCVLFSVWSFSYLLQLVLQESTLISSNLYPQRGRSEANTW